MKLVACFQTSGTTERCSVGLCVQMSGPGLFIAPLIKPFTMSRSPSASYVFWGSYNICDPFSCPLSDFLLFYLPSNLLTVHPPQ